MLYTNFWVLFESVYAIEVNESENIRFHYSTHRFIWLIFHFRSNKTKQWRWTNLTLVWVSPKWMLCGKQSRDRKRKRDIDVNFNCTMVKFWQNEHCHLIRNLFVWCNKIDYERWWYFSFVFLLLISFFFLLLSSSGNETLFRANWACFMHEFLWHNT